jgi:hypothetical protein
MKARAIFYAASLFACLSATAQEWQATPKSDPLTGQSYTLFTLTGKFLTPPAHGSGGGFPVISLSCDPTPWRRLSGRLLKGFLIVNTVIDLKNGGQSTVQLRLDDGKLQSPVSLQYSTDYQAINLDQIFVNNIIWGHLVPHKNGTNPQVRKLVIGVQEYLGGDVVMQFDMPDATQVAAACGTEYK